MQEANYSQTDMIDVNTGKEITAGIPNLPPDLQQAIQLYEMVYRSAHPKATLRNIRRVIQRKFGVKVVFVDTPKENI